MKQGTASYTLPGDAAAVLLSVEMLYLEEYSEMRLTKALAEKLLQEAWENPMNRPWITHCRAVGRTAGIIAAAIGEDGEFTEALGMVHDIEKKDTKEVVFHDLLGYEYLTGLGYDEASAAVCLTHSYLNNDDTCVAGGYLPENEFRTSFIRNHHYTECEKIVNLCDLMCKDTLMTFEERMIDLITRKGVHPNSAYHLMEAIKLKNYFDAKVPGGIYSLFTDLHLMNGTTIIF